MPDSPGLFTLHTFSSPLTIDHTQVPSTQSNFPVLVNAINSRFKTTANGGHVYNSQGYDIRFFSDSALTTLLQWEMERYNPTSGEVVAWVKIPSVSSVSDTVFYMSYGDSTISSDQSVPANVWTNSFLAVYHLKDGTTLSVLDSLNTNNGTNHSATAASGQIDGCAGFVAASTQYINLSNGMNPTAITYSAWVKAASFPNTYNAIIGRNNNTGTYTEIRTNTSGKMACYVKATADVSYDGTGANTLSAGTWYYLAMTYDSSEGLVGYFNAGVDKSVAANGAIITTAITTYIGADIAVGVRYWDGQIDEARIANVARSADWITCEYNNQKASSTFVTLGTEV